MMNAKEKFQDAYELARARAMAGEIEGGQTTVEYVIVVAIVLGVAALLVAFRNNLGSMIDNATNRLKALFTDLSSNM